MVHVTNLPREAREQARRRVIENGRDAISRLTDVLRETRDTLGEMLHDPRYSEVNEELIGRCINTELQQLYTSSKELWTVAKDNDFDDWSVFTRKQLKCLDDKLMKLENKRPNTRLLPHGAFHKMAIESSNRVIDAGTFDMLHKTVAALNHRDFIADRHGMSR
ncbi:MAG: hypothetical protein K2Q12_10395 [Rickettsiales bacterium]|nr:hypothetical protein [Rickettsiales bacterium]